jgi:hypothetical protein
MAQECHCDYLKMGAFIRIVVLVDMYIDAISDLYSSSAGKKNHMMELQIVCLFWNWVWSRTVASEFA